jgi:cyclopropane fatty-acyl-phospholipid synthase-like methyltransferase
MTTPTERTQQARQEDFERVQQLYDVDMPGNNVVHDLIYPHVYGEGEYIGQFSDNSASEIIAMAEAMKLGQGAEVLDVGCGTAPIASLLARRLGWRVTGIDLSRASLRKARLRIQAARQEQQVPLIEGNIYEQSFDQRFDGIYGTGSFCHFEAGRLFRRCHQLLRPGGRLAFMERVRLGPIGAENWKKVTEDWACPSVYSLDEYESILCDAGFRVVHLRNQTETFCHWQSRSVEVRRRLREEIIGLTSADYYETSLRLASYENELTSTGLLGYAQFVAEAA